MNSMNLPKPNERPIVVIGGAGFIGSNLAKSFLEDGRSVIVVDNLSRPGVGRNLAWLQGMYGSRVHPVITDIRTEPRLTEILSRAAAVLHMAGQVAVTASLSDPLEDFGINAYGTLRVLEALRSVGRPTPLLYASTNKVYGSLADVELEKTTFGYLPCNEILRSHGINEARPLDFCTPYGCSKGVADQYVLDYSRSFGIPTAVLRMSCIYGPRQFGTEDQGWVAHFVLQALRKSPITIYGDGCQVRDILHVNDAVQAYRGALGSIDRIAGQAFNLGGGPANAVSLRSVLEAIETTFGDKLYMQHGECRKGDQPYFVADTRALRNALGWEPRIGWRDGLSDLWTWLRSIEDASDLSPRLAEVHTA